VANFEVWTHEVLVRFARETQGKITHLEEEVQTLLQDRKDLINEVRRLIKEQSNDTGSENEGGSQKNTG
jgi:DNA-binding ferritin-like protein